MGDCKLLTPPPRDMPLVLRAHPFSADPGVIYTRAGMTVAEMLEEIADGKPLAALEVRVNGHVVPNELWCRLRPKLGARVEVTAVPAGGMNDNWRSALMIVAMVVVSFYAPTWGASLAGQFGGYAAAWTLGINMATALAANALVKPPTPASHEQGRQWNELTGNSNQINPGGVIPHVLGGVRYFPTHAAMPYTVAAGGHSWQYCLFDLGYNVDPDDVDLSTATIGDTPLSQFEGVTTQVGFNPSLYRNDTAQLAIQTELEDEDEVIRTTSQGAETIALDFVCPGGYFRVGSGGERQLLELHLDVHYRPIGTSTWLQPGSPRLSNLNHNPSPGSMYTKMFRWYDPVTLGVSWDVPAGQYEVRVRRRTTPGLTEHSSSMLVLNSMLSVRQVPASRTGTLKLAMRIRSDNQLSGTMQTFSLLLEPKYPVYNEAANSWSRQRTTNPAWIYHYLLASSPATTRKVPASRIHLTQILDFADYCDRHGFECRMVADTESTLGQVVDLVLRTAGGERTMTDGKYGVTFLPEEEPTNAFDFAETESKNFTLSRSFVRMPHALRVKFRNPLANWQDDEIVVLDDGYSYRGVDARGQPSSLPEAELFEIFELQAMMLPQQAWMLGRMYIAQAKFTPATHAFETDVTAFKVTKGSAITVQNPVAEWGVGAGTVRSIAAGAPPGAGAATLVLDAEIETDPTESYRMQIRGPGGTQAVACVPHSPRTGTFYLASMPAGVKKGDVGILGIAGKESPLLIVTSMRGTTNLDFTVNAVAWDARIAPFWADPPENLVSEVSGLPYTEPPDPPAITVVAGVTESDDAGIPTPVLNIHHRETGGHYLAMR